MLISHLQFFHSTVENETCSHRTLPENCLPMLLGQADFCLSCGSWHDLRLSSSLAQPWTRRYERLEDITRVWLGTTFLRTSGNRITICLPWSCVIPGLTLKVSSRESPDSPKLTRRTSTRIPWIRPINCVCTVDPTPITCLEFSWSPLWFQ